MLCSIALYKTRYCLPLLLLLFVTLLLLLLHTHVCHPGRFVLCPSCQLALCYVSIPFFVRTKQLLINCRSSALFFCPLACFPLFVLQFLARASFFLFIVKRKRIHRMCVSYVSSWVQGEAPRVVETFALSNGRGESFKNIL